LPAGRAAARRVTEAFAVVEARVGDPRAVQAALAAMDAAVGAGERQQPQ
jgi:hypothetical protein